MSEHLIKFHHGITWDFAIDGGKSAMQVQHKMIGPTLTNCYRTLTHSKKYLHCSNIGQRSICQQMPKSGPKFNCSEQYSGTLQIRGVSIPTIFQQFSNPTIPELFPQTVNNGSTISTTWAVLVKHPLNFFTDESITELYNSQLSLSEQFKVHLLIIARSITRHSRFDHRFLILQCISIVKSAQLLDRKNIRF